MHSLSAEAATDALVLFLKRSTLLATAIRDSRIASYLLAATTNELRRVQEYSLLLSRLAKCRVATFLIDLSMRMGNSNYLDLPMSHLDIADHLGLKIETVSRTITELVKSGSIARASYRALVLRDRITGRIMGDRSPAHAARLQRRGNRMKRELSGPSRFHPRSRPLRYAARGNIVKTLIIKRSVVLNGHKTSVSLENEFWDGLCEIARR